MFAHRSNRSLNVVEVLQNQPVSRPGDPQRQGSLRKSQLHTDSKTVSHKLLFFLRDDLSPHIHHIAPDWPSSGKWNSDGGRFNIHIRYSNLFQLFLGIVEPSTPDQDQSPYSTILRGRLWVPCYVFISELLIQVVRGEALENGSMNNVIIYLREHEGNAV